MNLPIYLLSLVAIMKCTSSAGLHHTNISRTEFVFLYRTVRHTWLPIFLTLFVLYTPCFFRLSKVLWPLFPDKSISASWVWYTGAVAGWLCDISGAEGAGGAIGGSCWVSLKWGVPVLVGPAPCVFLLFWKHMQTPPTPQMQQQQISNPNTGSRVTKRMKYVFACSLSYSHCLSVL